MSATALLSWCPSCREWTVTDVGRPCVWCDTRTIRRRGGWTRPDLRSRISEPAARAIHRKYAAGVSARTLGRELHEVLGYGSPQSCETAIGKAFRRYRLPVRGRIEATVLASTKSGLSPRDEHERARRRKQAGLRRNGRPRQPRCEAMKTQAPGKGRRCSRPAMAGSAFCQAHNPKLAAATTERLEQARASLDRGPTVEWEQVAAQLRPWLDGQQHPATALHRATGVPHGTCSRLLLGRHDTITVALADRLLAAVAQERRAA